MKEYNVKPGETVFLGRRWEHHARRIVFDISDWVDDFGAGTVQLLHQRQGDEAPYPVAVTRTKSDGLTVDNETGTLIHWDVTNVDTHYLCHYGKAELRYYRGAQVSPEFLAKSDISNTVVENALGSALADAPEEEPDWLATLLTATESVDSQIEAAREYAGEARTYAGNAETYAGNAQTYAGDASEAQSAAETYASNAATSAQEAETHKNEIATMYVSARSLPSGQEASVQMQESITLPRQLVMRFGIPRGENGNTFTPSVSANGDLSWTNDGGLTNPETRNLKGAAGVSVTDVTQTVTSLESGGANTITVTLSDGTSRSFHVLNGSKGDAGTFSPQDLQRITGLEAENALLRELLQGVDAPIYRTEPKDSSEKVNPATFDDGAAANVKSLSVEITPTQSGSGDPYPPGGGKNKANVADFTLIRQSNRTKTARVSVPAGVYTFSMTVSANSTTKVGMICSFSNNTNYEFAISSNGNAGRFSFTRTFNSELISLYFYIPESDPDGASVTISQFQLESGQTATDYAPYSNVRPISGTTSVTVTRTGENGANPQTVTVSLVDSSDAPLTVYGGSLNLTTGELTVTHKMLALNTRDMGTSAEYPGWGNVAELNGTAVDTLDINGVVPDAMCNIHPFIRANTLGTNRILCWRANEIGTPLDELKAMALDVQILLPLLSPAAYQLTPAQLATLSGHNAVSTDAQSVTVEYQSNYGGAKALTFTDIAASSPVGEQHRMIFGGRNLGSAVTAAQIAAVRDGSFSGLLTGDYWTINGVTWRIADMDYWYACGDTAFNRHHLVIMPDSNLVSAKMNDTNTTAGGYTGSKMYTDTLPTVKTTCAAAFPDIILTHREYLVSAVTNGKPSAAVWADSDVELPSEIMIYGSHILGPGNDGATVPVLNTINKSQLALFGLAPRFIKASTASWLRDPVSATFFALVYHSGAANCAYASSDGGVRPAFAIG